MPSHNQGTVNPPITERGLGKSASNDLKVSFPTSPVFNDMSEDSIREFYQKQVLDGITNDGGHTFGTHDPNYVDAPDFEDVETGDAGKPASAFVPNPTSPGEGSADPSDQKPAPEGFGETPSDTPFVGVGSQLTPKASSQAISRQTLGDYGFGKSSN